MADTRTSARSTSAWMPFINSSAAVSTTSTDPFTILDPSLSSSSSSPSSLPSPPLSTTSITSTSFSRALFNPATSLSESSSSFSSAFISSPASESEVPTTALFRSPAESSLTVEPVEPVFNLPGIPVPISSSPSSTSIIASTFLSSTLASETTGNTPASLSTSGGLSAVTLSTVSQLISNIPSYSSTSSIPLVGTPNTRTSRATSNLPSSSQTTSRNATQPPPLDVSSPTSITIINPSIPSTSPTSPSPPTPPITTKGAPPVLKTLAIVISAVVSVLLLSIVLRQLVTRRRQRRSKQRQSLHPNTGEDLFPPPIPPPTACSTHSVATTYHSALRGAVHVVVDRPPANGRRWRVPPSRAGYYAGPTGSGGMGGRTMDPGQWSVTNLDRRNGVLDTEPGIRSNIRGYSQANKGGIGRAH